MISVYYTNKFVLMKKFLKFHLIKINMHKKKIFIFVSYLIP